MLLSKAMEPNGFRATCRPMRIRFEEFFQRGQRCEAVRMTGLPHGWKRLRLEGETTPQANSTVAGDTLLRKALVQLPKVGIDVEIS